jgi:hypothetical protein
MYSFSIQYKINVSTMQSSKLLEKGERKKKYLFKGKERNSLEDNKKHSGIMTEIDIKLATF